NSVPDHLHLFIGLNPNQSLSDLMRFVKGDSAEFINKEKLTKEKFHWQSGYAAFTNSHSQIDKVVTYILNQKKHHKKTSFKEEYLSFLEKYKIKYDPKYLFSDLA